MKELIVPASCGKLSPSSAIFQARYEFKKWAKYQIFSSFARRIAVGGCVIVTITLISADFLASDFIHEHELPTFLSQAESGGTTILPVIVAPCLFLDSGLDSFQPINSPTKPLDGMMRSQQEQIVVNWALAIKNRLTSGEP